MDMKKIPEDAVEKYGHRDSEEFEQLKKAEAQLQELFNRLEEQSDQSIESEPVDSEHPYFSMLGRISVPGELDTRVFYPEQVSTGEKPWEWRRETSDMSIEEVYPQDAGRTLDEAIEHRIPHEAVIDIHGEKITNGGELIGAGVSRLTEPKRTYQIISYSDIHFPEEEALKHAEEDNPAATKIAHQEINEKALALTTVVIEQQNALVETDYITPTYDMMTDSSGMF